MCQTKAWSCRFLIVLLVLKIILRIKSEPFWLCELLRLHHDHHLAFEVVCDFSVENTLNFVVCSFSQAHVLEQSIFVPQNKNLVALNFQVSVRLVLADFDMCVFRDL